MPELVIQTLVCTFPCNPPFQEALWHDMHGIICSTCPPSKKHIPCRFRRFSSHCVFLIAIVLLTHHPAASLPNAFFLQPAISPLFLFTHHSVSPLTVLFTHHPAVSFPTVFFITIVLFTHNPAVSLPTVSSIILPFPLCFCLPILLFLL